MCDDCRLCTGMLHLCRKSNTESNLFGGGVFACANNLANGHGGNHVFLSEFTNNGGCWFTALLLDQFVAVQCDDALYFAAIQSLLVEFFAQFEFNFGILECGRCNQSVFVTILFQFDGRRDWVSDLAEHKSNTCKWEWKRRIKQPSTTTHLLNLHIFWCQQIGNKPLNAGSQVNCCCKMQIKDANLIKLLVMCACSLMYALSARSFVRSFVHSFANTWIHRNQAAFILCLN